MKDATSLLRSATKRAKSDVANKLVSMFLHELSRKISSEWKMPVDGEQYGEIVRRWFSNRCPYCSKDLIREIAIVEHLDGMNRFRAGLHVAGNVVVACRICNSEKRRDDSKFALTLADSGWASFLSHDGTRCASTCGSCTYWRQLWPDQDMRCTSLRSNRQRITEFRASFESFAGTASTVRETLANILPKLYLDCQTFAKNEIAILLQRLADSNYQL